MTFGLLKNRRPNSVCQAECDEYEDIDQVEPGKQGVYPGVSPCPFRDPGRFIDSHDDKCPEEHLQEREQEYCNGKNVEVYGFSKPHVPDAVKGTRQAAERAGAAKDYEGRAGPGSRQAVEER